MESRKDCETRSEESSHDKNSMFNQDITTSQQETLDHQAEGFTMKNTIEKQEEGNKEMTEQIASINNEEASTLASQALPDTDDLDNAFAEVLKQAEWIAYELINSVGNKVRKKDEAYMEEREKKLKWLLELLDDQDFIEYLVGSKLKLLYKIESVISSIWETEYYSNWSEEDYQREREAEYEYHAMQAELEASNTDM